MLYCLTSCAHQTCVTDIQRAYTYNLYTRTLYPSYFINFYKNILYFSICFHCTICYGVVCSCLMVLTVRYRKTFINGRGFLKNVCLVFSLFCFVCHCIFFIRAVDIISFFFIKICFTNHSVECNSIE